MQQGFKKTYRFCLQAVFIDVIVLTFRASGKSIGGLVVKALTCWFSYIIDYPTWYSIVLMINLMKIRQKDKIVMSTCGAGWNMDWYGLLRLGIRHCKGNEPDCTCCRRKKHMANIECQVGHQTTH